jgi:16S rRNA G966 N2-methylase RsmD
MPSPLSVEQASSEETARYKALLFKQRYLENGGAAAVSIADLTGGMGIDSWAFGQEFAQVYYVEQQAVLAALASHNYKQLQCNNIEVHHSTAEAFLQELQQPLKVIYLDPARRDATSKKVVLLSDSEPNVVTLLPLLLQKAQQIWVKASPMLDIKGAMQELRKHVQEVQVVSLRGEVKELLFRIEKQQELDPLIVAVNLVAGGFLEVFSFHYSEESSAVSLLSMPQTYLYDAGAALRKAGAFKLPAQRYLLKKLHAHSHLYTSDQWVEAFPGRSFRILGRLKADKKLLRQLLPSARAHLVVRNFPQKAEVLQKKLGLQEGDPHYVFATTLADGKPQLLLCERL